MPIAASTPNRTAAHDQSPQQGDYQEIIPGIPQGSLYPTLSAISSGPVDTATDEHSLCTKVTKGLNQYFQEAEQLWEIEDNYFNAITRSTNTSATLEVDNQEDKALNTDIEKAK